MLPDTIPSPKAAEAFEAQLRQLDLPEAPASLDARMQALLAAPPVAASMPKRSFWKKEFPRVAAVAGLAACAVLVVQLGRQAPTSTPTQPIASVIATPDAATEIAPPPTAQAQLPVFEGAVPVGYQYQSSRALYVEEIPVGTLHTDTPQQAYQRRTLLRHTFENPRTRATYEVDVPQEDLVLKDLQSF